MSEIIEKIKEDLQKLCQEIEKLPASEQQTKISLMASDLYQALTKLQKLEVKTEIMPETQSNFDPKVLVEHIDTFGKGLNEWEKKIIANLIDNPPKVYSPKVIEIINRIYDEKC